MNQTEFTHKEVLKVFPDINARTLISWSERGLVKPEVEDASGRGTKRRYSYKNLIEVGFVQELLSYKLPFSLIQNFIMGLSHAIEEYGFDLVFCTFRTPEDFSSEGAMVRYIPLRDFFKSSTESMLRSIVKSGPLGGPVKSMILINLSEIKNHIDKQIKKF